MQSQFEQTERGNFAVLERGEIRHDPQHTLSDGYPRGQCCRKSGCGRFITRTRGKNLVQRAAGEPALQTGVRVAVTERDSVTTVRLLEPCPGERTPEKSELLRYR